MPQYTKAAIQINTAPAKLVAQYTIVTTLRSPAGTEAPLVMAPLSEYTWHVAYWRHANGPMPNVTMRPGAITERGYATEPAAYLTAQNEIEAELNRGRAEGELVFLFG